MAIGTNVRVTCRAAGWPRPEVTLSLIGPSRDIKETEKGLVVSGAGEAELKFRADGKSEIQCFAKNNLGQVQQKATMVVERKLFLRQ